MNRREGRRESTKQMDNEKMEEDYRAAPHSCVGMMFPIASKFHTATRSNKSFYVDKMITTIVIVAGYIGG